MIKVHPKSKFPNASDFDVNATAFSLSVRAQNMVLLQGQLENRVIPHSLKWEYCDKRFLRISLEKRSKTRPWKRLFEAPMDDLLDGFTKTDDGRIVVDRKYYFDGLSQCPDWRPVESSPPNASHLPALQALSNGSFGTVRRRLTMNTPTAMPETASECAPVHEDQSAGAITRSGVSPTGRIWRGKAPKLSHK